MTKAFIVEFQEAFDFVQTYRTLLRNNRFVLRTRVALELGERVKIRFNTPDGNGVTIRCKIATQIDDQAWGITLPTNEDTVWLQEKAVDTEKRLGPGAQRLPKAAAGDDWNNTQSGRGSYASGTKKKGRAASTRKAGRQDGPITVDILPSAGPETQVLSYGAPEAEFVDPEQDGFPGLKDTGLDLLKDQDQPRVEPIVVRQSPGQESLGITQVVRRESGTGESGTGELLPGSAPIDDPSGDAGIDFPQGVRRPSPKAVKRIQGMPNARKKQLAISGNATERMVLIQDRERVIQIWVLKNPQITEPEVRWLSSMTTLTTESVEFLVGNRKWSSLPEIAINLISNPTTPNDAVQRLLTILPTQVLLMLQQKPGVRPMVADMARKLLIERGEG